MISTIINSIGLLFDIIGGVILFYYGLPPTIKNGVMYSFHRNEELPDIKIYAKKSNCGLIMLIIGFVLQLASNLLNICET